jgi:hypothetical protein
MRDAAGHLSAKNLKKVQEAQHLAIYTPFIQLFTQAHQTQEITAHDPKTLAILFVSLLDAMAINTLCDEGRPFDYAQKAQTLVNGFFDGFAKRSVD